MPITQAVATSFKRQLLEGSHDFRAVGGHVFKIALYTSAADLDATTEAYTAVEEVVGEGYEAGGSALTNIGTGVEETVAFLDFQDVFWTLASITARGAMIYNETLGGACVCVLDFGSDFTTQAGTFTVVFPAATATTAILRLRTPPPP